MLKYKLTRDFLVNKSLGQDAESSHESSLELKGLRDLNVSLLINVKLLPIGVESLLKVLFGVGFWQVVPFFNYVSRGLPSCVFGEHVITIWVSFLIGTRLCVWIENTLHVVLILRGRVVLRNLADLTYLGVGIVEFLICHGLRIQLVLLGQEVINFVKWFLFNLNSICHQHQSWCYLDKFHFFIYKI